MAKDYGTQLDRFVTASAGQVVWVGLDVHKTKWYVAIYRSDGQIFNLHNLISNRSIRESASLLGAENRKSSL